MLKYLTLNTTVEWICLIVGFICLRRDKSIAWKGMILLLVFTCVIESAGIYVKFKYLADPENVRPNIWLYNLLLIFQAGIISAMFVSLFKEYRKLSLTIFSGLSLLSLVYLYEQIDHGLFEKHILTFLLMSVLFTIYSFIFFYLLLYDGSQNDLKYDASFWWVTGTLFYFFGSIMSNLFYETIRDNLSNQSYLKYIFRILNVMLYGCWSYSFILRKWTRRKSGT